MPGKSDLFNYSKYHNTQYHDSNNQYSEKKRSKKDHSHKHDSSDSNVKLAHNYEVKLKELDKAFRQVQAYQLVIDSSAQSVFALDNVLYAAGVGTPPTPIDPFFSTNVQFVLSEQVDENNMNIFIDGNQINNSTDFVIAWNGLTNLYKYRKRYLSDNTLVSYCDIDGVREVTYAATGTSFAIFNTPKMFNDVTTDTFIIFDRYLVTKLEVSPNNFKIKSLVQQTESTFPIGSGTSGAAVGSVAGGVNNQPSLPNMASNPAIYTIPPAPVTCPNDQL